ncbi:MAG: hypothetical protein LBJ98_02475 [Endomicrobium sp.]|jgi:hypothetical protein|nr:hypothetical protein [Endomicrobium sp.]
MKKFVLVVMMCCSFAVSGSHAFDMKCDKLFDNCMKMYELRVRLGGQYLREALDFCHNALDYCKSVGENCWKAEGILRDHNEL